MIIKNSFMKKKESIALAILSRQEEMVRSLQIEHEKAATKHILTDVNPFSKASQNEVHC